MDSGMGAADTSEIIKVESSATRPACEYCMIVGPAELKVEMERNGERGLHLLQGLEGCVSTDLDVRLTVGKLYISHFFIFYVTKWKFCGTNSGPMIRR